MATSQLQLGYAMGSNGSVSLSEQSRSSSRNASSRATSEASLDPVDAKLAAALINDLTSLATRQSGHVLISCSKKKGALAAPAAELYSSSLFIQSANLARRLSIPFSILSGKYGLIEPDRVIEPYNVSLRTLTNVQQAEWADTVAEEIKNRFSPESTFILLAGKTYGKPLISRLKALGCDVGAPLDGLSLGRRLARLKQAHRILDRHDAVKSFYENLSELARHKGLLSLAEVLSGPLPKRGVYFFFDPDEATRFSSKLPRLVRVGTHGVSSGSKATLRDRLRAHLGTAEGFGNHRSSVFRLHVGEALLRREGMASEYSSWGKGQSAGDSITRAERDIERLVSSYLARMLVLYVEIRDEPGKNSLRALLERNSIALFTEQNVHIDQSSLGWLGRYSKQSSVRESGLWNVRDVGNIADISVTKFIANDDFEQRLSNLPAYQEKRTWF